MLRAACAARRALAGKQVCANALSARWHIAQNAREVHTCWRRLASQRPRGTQHRATSRCRHHL